MASLDSSTLWTILIGIVIIIAGYLIRFKQMFFLIAGYNEKNFLGNKERLGKRVGTITVIMGVIVVILPFLFSWIGDSVGPIFAFVIVAGVALIIFSVKFGR